MWFSIVRGPIGSSLVLFGGRDLKLCSAVTDMSILSYIQLYFYCTYYLIVWNNLANVYLWRRCFAALGPPPVQKISSCGKLPTGISCFFHPSERVVCFAKPLRLIKMHAIDQSRWRTLDGKGRTFTGQSCGSKAKTCIKIYFLAVSHKDWELLNLRIWLAKIEIESGPDFPN